MLKRGFVLVGSVTIYGTFGTLQPGSLLVLDRNGVLKATLTNLLDSPWDLTIQDGGSWARVFVSNVRSGTITRLDLDVDPGGISVRTATEIASGYTSYSDPAALIVGPMAWRTMRRTTLFTSRQLRTTKSSRTSMPPPLVNRRVQAQ